MKRICENCAFWQGGGEVGLCRMAKDEPVDTVPVRWARATPSIGFQHGHDKGEPWSMPEGAAQPLIKRLKIRVEGGLYTSRDFGCNRFKAAVVRSGEVRP